MSRLERWRGALPAVLLALLLACLLLATDSPPERLLRETWFDTEQRLAPRERINDGVVVVQIDDESLAKLGEWPWPRRVVAELIQRILAQQPVALGIDIVFAEADRYSAARLMRNLHEAGVVQPPQALAALPDGDLALAEALRGAPVVLGMIGLADRSSSTPLRNTRLQQTGGDASRRLPQYQGALRSLPSLLAAAASEALLSASAEQGLIRRVPTLALVGGIAVPGLAVEMLRVGSGGEALQLRNQGAAIRSLRVADLDIPTDADGGWRLHFSDFHQRPHLSAAQLLDGSAPADVLGGRLVLLGYTASGLLDVISTPLGVMPGVEAHAEAIDNLLDSRLLHRPAWSGWIEALSLLLLAWLASAALAWRTPAFAALIYGATSAALFAVSHAAFLRSAWLLDAATPAVGAALVLGLRLAGSLAESRRQRHRLRAALALSREAEARLAGELDAARRIQLGILPTPARALGNEQRVEIAAEMQAARSVGGDLFDFFLQDGRLWFLVGDVSGKGLPASLFMILAKSHIRGAAALAPDDPGRALSLAAERLAAENAEQQFVTVLAGVLDLASGVLVLASAGHDAPVRLRAGLPPQPLALIGGPPLCVVEDFCYPSEPASLAPGDSLCLFTDGVTESLNSRRELWGSQAWSAALATLSDAEPGRELEKLRAALHAHIGAAELADDWTLLLLRWNPFAAEVPPSGR